MVLLLYCEIALDFCKILKMNNLKKKAKCVLGITASGVSVHGQSALFLFVLC